MGGYTFAPSYCKNRLEISIFWYQGVSRYSLSNTFSYFKLISVLEMQRIHLIYCSTTGIPLLAFFLPCESRFRFFQLNIHLCRYEQQTLYRFYTLCRIKELRYGRELPHKYKLLGCIITVRNEVAKVMFLHLSVCPQRGWVLPQCMLGYPPGADTPPRADTPPSRRLLLRTVRILLECILVICNGLLIE